MKNVTIIRDRGESPRSRNRLRKNFRKKEEIEASFDQMVDTCLGNCPFQKGTSTGCVVPIFVWARAVGVRTHIPRLHRIITCARKANSPLYAVVLLCQLLCWQQQLQQRAIQ